MTEKTCLACKNKRCFIANFVPQDKKIENWFYAIHDRLDYLDPTGEECD